MGTKSFIQLLLLILKNLKAEYYGLDASKKDRK